jgi:tetratricopeptide (TPR) repeat protein
MYPYRRRTPLLKLNQDPRPGLDPQLVKNDHAVWGWYTKWLLDQSAFRRDICARKSFSKLRSAIAGIYDYRRMYDEAEYAFKQSIDLYPLSPEATFRLAQMYLNMQRFDDAEKAHRELRRRSQERHAKGFLGQIEGTKRKIDRRREIERKLHETACSRGRALELTSIYRAEGIAGAYQNWRRACWATTTCRRSTSGAGRLSCAGQRVTTDLRARAVTSSARRATSTSGWIWPHLRVRRRVADAVNAAPGPSNWGATRPATSSCATALTAAGHQREFRACSAPGPAGRSARRVPRRRGGAAEHARLAARRARGGTFRTVVCRARARRRHGLRRARVWTPRVRRAGRWVLSNRVFEIGSKTAASSRQVLPPRP